MYNKTPFYFSNMKTGNISADLATHKTDFVAETADVNVFHCILYFLLYSFILFIVFYSLVFKNGTKVGP